MTKGANIGQGDIERALKACKRAGYDKARVHINVAAQTIDIILGEDQPKAPPAYNPWDEEFKKAESEAMLERVKKRLEDNPPAPPRKRQILPAAPSPAEVEASRLRARSRTRGKGRAP